MTIQQARKEMTLSMLNALPTLSQGHTDNLKFEDHNTRIWLSRMTKEDGMPYDNQVTVEMYRHKVTAKTDTWKWDIVKHYQAL